MNKQRNWYFNGFFGILHHSNKKWKDSLKTRAELAILGTYFKNQAILEPTLLYHGSAEQ